MQFFRSYKKLSITALICILIWGYIYHIIYFLYLIHIYPVKAQVQDVAIEFNGTWLPAASSESPLWYFLKSENSQPSVIFYKIETLKPFTQGTMAISRIDDKYDGYSRKGENFSSSTHFDWGTAKIIKKEMTADPTRVFAVIPEFNILIGADNLDQLKEIKSITKIHGLSEKQK